MGVKFGGAKRAAQSAAQSASAPKTEPRSIFIDRDGNPTEAERVASNYLYENIEFYEPGISQQTRAQRKPKYEKAKKAYEEVIAKTTTEDLIETWNDVAGGYTHKQIIRKGTLEALGKYLSNKISPIARELHKRGYKYTDKGWVLDKAKTSKTAAKPATAKETTPKTAKASAKVDPKKAAAVVKNFVATEGNRSSIKKPYHDKKNGVVVATDGKTIIVTKHGFDPNAENVENFPISWRMMPDPKNLSAPREVNVSKLIDLCNDAIRLSAVNKDIGAAIFLNLNGQYTLFDARLLKRVLGAMQVNGINEIRVDEASRARLVFAQNADTTIVLMPMRTVSALSQNASPRSIHYLNGENVILDGETGRLVSAPARGVNKEEIQEKAQMGKTTKSLENRLALEDEIDAWIANGEKPVRQEPEQKTREKSAEAKAAAIVKDFVATDDWYPNLKKPYHDKKNGVVVATDGKAMIVTKHGFDPSAKNDEHFPDYRQTLSITDKPSAPQKVDVDKLIERCNDAIRLSGISTRTHALVSLKINGRYGLFDARQLKRVLRAMKANGINEVREDGRGVGQKYVCPIFAQNENTTILLLPAYTPTKRDYFPEGISNRELPSPRRGDFSSVLIDGETGRLITAPLTTDRPGANKTSESRLALENEIDARIAEAQKAVGQENASQPTKERAADAEKATPTAYEAWLAKYSLKDTPAHRAEFEKKQASGAIKSPKVEAQTPAAKSTAKSEAQPQAATTAKSTARDVNAEITRVYEKMNATSDAAEKASLRKQLLDLFSEKEKQDAAHRQKMQSLPQAEQGKPYTATVYHGEGKARGEIYAGVQQPVAGEGKYMAFTPEDAQRYGDKVSADKVTLSKPYVVRDDADWDRLTTKAGWKNPNPFGVSESDFNHLAAKLKDTLTREGYDGLVVQYEGAKVGDTNTRTGGNIRTLNDVFGHDQVVVYKANAPAVQSKAKSAAQATAAKVAAPTKEESQKAAKVLGMDAFLPDAALKAKVRAWEQHAADPRVKARLDAAKVILVDRAAKGKAPLSEDDKVEMAIDSLRRRAGKGNVSLRKGSATASVKGKNNGSAALFDSPELARREYDAVVRRYTNADGTKRRGWMKAPNGQPTNLTERQWVQVRTPAFKNWFGDWEALAEAADARTAQSIEDAMQIVRDAGILNTPIENNHLGITATISNASLAKMGSEKAAKKSVSPRLHALAIANVDKLFASATLETTHPDTHARAEVEQVRRLGTAMRDPQSGAFVPVMLTVVEYKKDGKKVYSVEAVDIEKYENSAGQLVAFTESERQTPIAEFVNSIAHLAENINPNSVSKVVDENGEPKPIDDCFVNFNQATFYSKRIAQAKYWIDKIVEWERTYNEKYPSRLFWENVIYNNAEGADEYITARGDLDILVAAIKSGITPELKIAYRYGEIPKDMRSHNYRDDFNEMGVSVVGRVADMNTARNYYYQAFFGHQPYNVVIGFDVGHTGSDGEMLLSPAMVLTKADEIGNVIKSATDNTGAFSPADNDIRFDSPELMRHQPRGEQKSADVNYPDAAEEIRNNLHFPIGRKVREGIRFDSPELGKRARADAIALIKRKRPDLAEGVAEKAVDEIGKFNTTKAQKAALHWFIRGTIRLPEDAPKVTEALGYAERAKGRGNTDALSYDSPLAMIDTLHDYKPKAKPIDPDTVPQLSDKRDFAYGVTTYLVQDDREGQKAMREIINTHWGEDANPWCLLHGDGKGNLSDGTNGEYDAWRFWQVYSAWPKRVAFKDGKLLAFSASDIEEQKWWDRRDRQYEGIPLGINLIKGSDEVYADMEVSRNNTLRISHLIADTKEIPGEASAEVTEDWRIKRMNLGHVGNLYFHFDNYQTQEEPYLEFGTQQYDVTFSLEGRFVSAFDMQTTRYCQFSSLPTIMQKQIKELFPKIKKEAMRFFDALNKIKQNKNDIRFDSPELARRDEIRAFLEGNPVAKATGHEYEGMDKKAIIDAVYKNWGRVYHRVNNPEIGLVELSKSGIRDSFAHGVGRAKIAAFNSVPEIISEGRVVRYRSNWEGRGYDSHIIAAPISIGGKAHVALAVVNSAQNSKRFYLHEVGLLDEIKKVAEVFRTGSSDEKSALSRNLGDIKSIAYSLFADKGGNETRFDSPELSAEKRAKEIHAYTDRYYTRQKALQRLNNPKADDFIDAAMSGWQKFRTAIQDKNLVIRELEERVGVTDKKKSVYYAKDREFGLNEYQLRQLEADYIKPILNDLTDLGVDIADFDLFLIANHAQSRNAVLRARSGVENGSGMSDADAAKHLAHYKEVGLYEPFSRIAERVYAMNDEALQRRVDSGRLEAEKADELRKQFKNYVPLRTDMENEEQEAYNTYSSGWHTRELRRAEGRKTLADSPLAWSIAQAERSIKDANLNRVRQVAADFVRAADAAGHKIGTIIPGRQVRNRWAFQLGENVLTLEELRDRAFFSSRVESARFLATCRDRLAQLLAQTADSSPDSPLPSRAQLVSDIMSAARQTGIATGKGGLTDPSSPRRATVIIDTNAGLAASYCRAELANSYGARLAFPAQELVRIEERNAKRDWRKRWLANGGKLYAGRMIALKSDPVWVKISRFNQPYPPFDFGSGMGTEDVSREEALALGVIKEDYTPPKSSPLTDFNATLEADLNFKNDDIWQSLKAIFGDQIRQQDGKISWRNDLIREAFTANKPFAIRLGSPTPNLLSKLPSSIPPNLVKDKPLTINEDWLNRKRKDGTDHRAHFQPLESHPNDIPLTLEDLELLPDIWRNPDKVEQTGRSRVMLSLKSLNGGTYKAVVDYEKRLDLKTLYKEG